MILKKLSIGKINLAVSAGLFLMIAAAVILGGIFIRDNVVIIYGIVISLLASVWFVIYTLLLKKKLDQFGSDFCQTLDEMINGNAKPQQSGEEETLFVKINHRLIRLYEIMEENRRRIAEEKTALQELTSDISHQVKTPIANLQMVTATLLEQEMPEEKRKEFLHAMAEQLSKLDFLMQAMIKTSRLETGVISLFKKPSSVYETLAAALGGILFSAEKQHINVFVDCSETLEVSHDAKWTAEALFNMLDNAVKYTPDGGSIHISATHMEMYTRIDIKDNGKGISESRHADVFKRFYREEEVHGKPGIGIGLYLAREIVDLQGGYIKLISEPGKGSTFSVFLPNS